MHGRLFLMPACPDAYRQTPMTTSWSTTKKTASTLAGNRKIHPMPDQSARGKHRYTADGDKGPAPLISSIEHAGDPIAHLACSEQQARIVFAGEDVPGTEARFQRSSDCALNTRGFGYAMKGVVEHQGDA